MRRTASWLSAGLLVAAALGPGAAGQSRISAERLEEMASRPTPRLPGRQPDLNGTWDHLGGIEFVRPQVLADGTICVLGCPPQDGPATPAPEEATREATFPRYRPEFLARVQELEERQVELDTALHCHPPGVPRIGPPAKIVQSAREVIFLYDDVNGSYFRIVPTDGRPHREELPPSYLGDAVGRFEGDTLVVETVNFNEETWLADNGAFHTADLRVVERLRRVGDTIEYEAIAHDPAILLEPWTERTQTLWLADWEIEESPRCEDRDMDLVEDGSHHDNPR
jgi:hypothetical protein